MGGSKSKFRCDVYRRRAGNNCGTEIPVYNSCRDRHCPTCQTVRKQQWVEHRQAELLPVPYFHAVSLPYTRVIQYTPHPAEPPNGPEHLEFYKTIQKAGRIVHIPITPENILALSGKVDPSLIMFDTYCKNEAEGRELLAKTANW